MILFTNISITDNHLNVRFAIKTIQSIEIDYLAPVCIYQTFRWKHLYVQIKNSQMGFIFVPRPLTGCNVSIFACEARSLTESGILASRSKKRKRFNMLIGKGQTGFFLIALQYREIVERIWRIRVRRNTTSPFGGKKLQ